MTTPKRSLFDLTSEMLEIEQILSNFDGEITDEDKEKAIDDLLSTMAEDEGGFTKKVDGYVYLMAELSGRAEIRTLESKRLAEMAFRDRKNQEKLENRLAVCLKMLGKEAFETDYHKLRFSKVGGKQAVTFLFEKIDDVPKKYRFQYKEWRLDKDTVREELEAGKMLAFAKLEERGEKLRIS